MENINTKELVQNALYTINEGYIISLWNDEMGCDTIFTRDDFDDHFRGDSILDVIDRLDSSFDASDDYFKDAYIIESASSLEDLIDYDHMEDFLVDCIENAIDRDSMPEGFEKLFDEYESLKRHPHTEDEIREKLNEMVMNLDDDSAIRMASYKMDKSGVPFCPMSEFVNVCVISAYSIPQLIGMFALSMGWFEFTDPFFTINNEKQFQSYSICGIKNEVWQGLCDNEFDDDWLKESGYKNFAEVRKGYWEE